MQSCCNENARIPPRLLERNGVPIPLRSSSLPLYERRDSCVNGTGQARKRHDSEKSILTIAENGAIIRRPGGAKTGYAICGWHRPGHGIAIIEIGAAAAVRRHSEGKLVQAAP